MTPPTDENQGGLAWPAHDLGPIPPPDSPAAERDEPATRKPLPLWDRVKFLLLITLVFWFFVWSAMADNPLLAFEDALDDTASSKWWLLALGGIELLRQLHFVVSEHSARWHRFWTQGVFGRFAERTSGIDDWNRFRIARVLKIVTALVLLDLVLAAVFDVSPATALFELPARLYMVLPMILQLAFAFFFVIFQFVGLFWFLSKGGVDVYFPDDIKTRFTDVWGQDAVVERVKENMVFLESPERIEEKGGFVPGGVLLWGPPGTGKGQPVSGLVMTPTGPRRMGDLLPGDLVMGSDGRPTRITEVHLLGERDLFRVAFSDGSSLRVTGDHLWEVSTRYRGTKVRPTNELIDRLVEADGRARFRIPMVAPVEFGPRELPLDPWLLGALLGDGTFRHHLGISSADLELLAKVEILLPDGDSLVRKSGYDWSIVGGATRTVVKELELFGVDVAELHVPAAYLWSGVADRVAILQGLLDSTGGMGSLHVRSRRLAEDVRLLVQSLGGTCSFEPATGAMFRLRIVLPNFGLGTPGTGVPRPKFPERRMVAIEPDGREDARCIRVEADDHLYVADQFIVTHNTLMAEAVAGETGKPFVFVDPGAFINMFMGVGILKVKSLFRKLRKLAVRYGGVIVFFDEADALGNRGMVSGGGTPGMGMGAPSAWSDRPGADHLRWLSEPAQREVLRVGLTPSTPVDPPARRRDRIMMGGMMGGGGGGTLQALLTELSGLKKPRGFLNRVVRRALGMQPKPPPKYRILVMMATNMPEALDQAMLRPGRIDRIYKVGYPSKEGRKRTYRGYLSKVRNELTEAEIEKLAIITPYATGATIKDLVNESLITAIRNGRDVITWRDVLKAKQLKELGPPEDVEYIERERHAVAVHEACHAVIAYRVRKHLMIDIATIEKGSTYLGMVSSIKPEDQFTQWRSEYEADILVALASLAGERLFFQGDNSSGVSGDLESATTIAALMEGDWGMGSTVSSHEVLRRIIRAATGQGERGLLRDPLGERIEAKLAELLDRAEQLLRENRQDVLAVAHALETHKTLSGDDVAAIIEGSVGPLVDGRVYHTPEFAKVAEEHHRLALSAHQTHSHSRIPLPVFTHMPSWDPNATGNGWHGPNGAVEVDEVDDEDAPDEPVEVAPRRAAARPAPRTRKAAPGNGATNPSKPAPRRRKPSD